MFRTATLIAGIALAALALAAPAQASPRDVVLDCARDGDLDREYSNSDLRRARSQVPTDIEEYSDCREVIAAALTSGSDRGGGRDNGDPGAGAGATAAERRAAEEAARAEDIAALDSKRGKPSVEVGGKQVAPGDNGLFSLASASNAVPLPLLLGIIAAALLAIVGGLAVLKRRAPELADRIPLLSKLSLPSVRLPRALRR